MALVLAEKKCIFSKIPQKCSVFNETQELSFFRRGDFNRAVVFSIFTFVCLLSWPQAFFCKTQLSSIFSTAVASEMTAHWFPNFFSGHFQLNQAICGPKLTEKGILGAIWRDSLWLPISLSLKSFLPLSRQTNDKFGNNLKIFKAPPHYLGKKLVEFDLDLLEITQNWQKRRDFTSSFFFPFFLSFFHSHIPI